MLGSGTAAARPVAWQHGHERSRFAIFISRISMILFRQSVPFRTWLRGLKSSAVPRKGEGNGDPMSRKFIFKYDDQEEVVMHSIRRVFCQLWLRHADTREVFKFG